MSTLDNKTQYVLVSIILFLSSISMTGQDFSVTFEEGHVYSSKPTLLTRLRDTEEIVMIVPIQQSEMEQYYYACIYNYFIRLGMPVREYQASFKKQVQQIGSVVGVSTILDDDIFDCWNHINSLVIITNYTCSYGEYTKRRDYLQLFIIDPINEFSWDFEFYIPKNETEFDSKLKECISPYRIYYDENASQIHPHYISNWKEETIFKEYFSNSPFHKFEGVYEGDNYKVAVKKDRNDKYYLIYLSGKYDSNDWSIGDVKAILEPTATSNLFKANWFGRWKQRMSYTILFNNGIMTTYDESHNSEQYIKLYPSLNDNYIQEIKEWSGTGFALKDNYIVTNYHVIEGAKTITIQGIKGNFDIKYNASIVGVDKNNDLALLKITDPNFSGFGTLPYSVKSKSSEVGEDIYVLGYPLTSTMGDEIKLTTGVISSKTGFQGDISSYQISAPIQPGNSGGPLFDKNGNVIGIVSAKHAGAENVGYAIKSVYLQNLVESCINSSILPSNNSVATMPLTGKVKTERKFVFFIGCSK